MHDGSPAQQYGDEQPGGNNPTVKEITCENLNNFILLSFINGSNIVASANLASPSKAVNSDRDEEHEGNRV